MENRLMQAAKENPLSRPAAYPLDILLAELKFGRPAEQQKLLDSFIESINVKKTYEVVLGDTTAHGCSHHNHNKHIVYVDGLSYEEALEIKEKFESVVNK